MDSVKSIISGSGHFDIENVLDVVIRLTKEPFSLHILGDKVWLYRTVRLILFYLLLKLNTMRKIQTYNLGLNNNYPDQAHFVRLHYRFWAFSNI